MRGKVATLVVSSNRGRYALDNAVEGPDLTSGMSLAVLLGDRWTFGSVEYARHIYAVQRPESPCLPALSGYYFISREGQVCGLCVGMQVRLL